MSSSKLGFGMMRLPQRSQEATDIDFEQVSQMVDRFLEAGFTYFDTSWAYHNGASETAVKRCLVSRHHPGGRGGGDLRPAAGAVRRGLL